MYNIKAITSNITIERLHIIAFFFIISLPIYNDFIMIKIIVATIMLYIHIFSFIVLFSFKYSSLIILVDTAYKELIGVTNNILPYFKAKEYKTFPIGVIPQPLIIAKLGFFIFIGVRAIIKAKKMLALV
jgi:hypothetical protein